MKYRLLTLLGVFALGSASLVMAQDYDDIYYDGTSSSDVTTTTKSTTMQTSAPGTVSRQRPATASAQPRRYKIAVEDNAAARDEDEYNRRGAYRNKGYAADTSSYYDDEQSSFSNTERIQRFYNPEVVDGSGDDELITLYYDTAPTINLVIGSSWGPSWGWGMSSWYDPWYSSWYSPWYSGWYDPFYYSSWYGWGRPWGWYSGWYSGWYDPWYYGYGGWGWNHYGWGWSYPGWSNSYWNSGWGYSDRWAGGRRPQGHGVNNGTYVGSNRPGYATASGARRPGGDGMSARSMGSTRGYMDNRGSTNLSGTHRRPGYATGNAGASRQYNGNIGNVGSMSRRPAVINNAGTRSQASNRFEGATTRMPNRTYTQPNRTYTQPNRTYTQPSRSYSSPAPSRSYGGGSYSGGGGYSGGSHSSGGGFSGGSGHRR